MPMPNSQFEAVTKILQEEADGILLAKGPDYASHAGDNRLANFELVAQLLQGAPIDATTVASVYWLKHVLAICTFIRNRRPGSEPILGRFADERNYNALLWACMVAGKDQDVTRELEGNTLPCRADADVERDPDKLERVFLEQCKADPGFLHRFLLALKEEVAAL